MHAWCNDPHCPAAERHEEYAAYEGMFEGLNEEAQLWET